MFDAFPTSLSAAGLVHYILISCVDLFARSTPVIPPHVSYQSLKRSSTMQSLHAPFLTYFLLISFYSILASAAPNCDCYSTTSKSSPQNLFLLHLFLDFRSITPGANENFSNAPPLVSTSKGAEPVTSSYFNSSAFTSNWQIQTWTQDANASADAPVELVNSAQNVFISKMPVIPFTSSARSGEKRAAVNTYDMTRG